jgi:hypothetical protein
MLSAITVAGLLAKVPAGAGKGFGTPVSAIGTKQLVSALEEAGVRISVSLEEPTSKL